MTMACSCSFDGTADQHFNTEKVAKELALYPPEGSPIDNAPASRRPPLLGTSSGDRARRRWRLGILSLELLDHGFKGAVVVDASSAYLAAAREEAARRGRMASTQFVHGDFVAVSNTLAPSTTVTLDRVVCCYPLYEQLLREAVRHAERGFAFSYPRDRWYVRAGMRLENALRRRRDSFRTFVHPETRMRELITRAGFDLVFQRRTLVWSADVFIRRA
jgi:hypothetical protein